MPIRYVHLRTHSEYSLRDSTIRIPEKPEYGDPAKAKHANLVSRAVELGMPALALTDDSNLFAQIKFYRAAEKAGLKPIVGCDVWIANPEDAARPDRLTLLCRDRTGYLNLSRLVSRGWLEGQHAGRAQLQAGWLDDAVAGLFAIAGRDSACGRLAAAGREHDARAELDALRGSFGDGLYLELTRTGRDGEDAFNAQALQLAARLDLPAIASNDVRFLDADDFEAHEARVCIQQGYQLDDPRRPHEYSPEQWLKPADTMAELFADLPEALDNTVELAKRCNLELSFGTYHLPAFPVPNRHSLETWIGEQARAGLDERIAEAGLAPGQTREDYDARLERELDVIGKMGFAGYFLIVSDFIRWAKSQDIPVGPGRGSGAGSVVAWCLKITDLDPLRFGLLFERFLNPERVSMPDFDVDFCMERRDEVIAYVADKYGRDQVSQIITYGSMAAKAVLRDCGRVLGMPYGQVDKIAKLIPRMPLDLTLGDALGISEKSKKEPDRVVREFCELYQQDDEAHTLIDLALKLEGLARNAGKHAGGVVIAPSALTDFAPLYSEPGGAGVVTQYDKNDVEEVGLVKFDFLGLKTLTVLDVAVKLLKQRDIDLDLSTLKLDDKDTYDMLARGDVVGVFQVESQGMRRALVDMRPDRLEDLIALVALYRPGPMANIPTYCARKHGDEEPEYMHPMLEPILKETFGVIIYQEQVMQIAQVMAGYSLGDADLLRRAMGKKIRAEMDKQREIFVAGAMKNNVPKGQAETIFELLAKFADYGFNKSHAAAYALVSYQTAYMKAHYPVEFIAASMTLDMSNTDKLSEFRAEAQRLGIKVEPPSINRSGATFEVSENTIYYALAALKGVGAHAIEQIVEARRKGLFTSLADFAARVSPRAINKRVIESLAAAGAFDTIERNRARAFAGADAILAASQRSFEAQTSGQNDMFGGMADAPSVMLPAIDSWLPADKLRREYDAIGFFLSGHPLDDYATILKRLRVQSWAEFSRAVKSGATAGKVAATVVSRMERRTKTGNKMGIIGLSDPTGHFEAVLFSEGLAQFREVLEPGAAVLLKLGAELQGDDVRARVLHAEPLDDAAAKTQKGLRIFLRDTKPLGSISKRLQPPAGATASGNISLVLQLDPQTEVEFELSGRFPVSPQIAGALKAVSGVVDVQVL